jgi:hypothetical protein
MSNRAFLNCKFAIVNEIKCNDIFVYEIYAKKNYKDNFELRQFYIRNWFNLFLVPCIFTQNIYTYYYTHQHKDMQWFKKVSEIGGTML